MDNLEFKDMIESMYDDLARISIMYRQVLIRLPDDKKTFWLPVHPAIDYLKNQISGARKRIQRRGT